MAGHRQTPFPISPTSVRSLRRTPVASRMALIVAVALPALAPSEVSAAPPWSASQTISSAAAVSPALGFDARGRALASWSGVSNGLASRTATRAPGGTAFAPERAAPNFAAPPVVYGYARALALVEQRSPRLERCGDRVSLSARFGQSDGVFGVRRRISSFVPAAFPYVAVAANNAGQALAAWIESSRNCKPRVVISLRRPGGKFGSPVTLRSGAAYQARETARGVSAAVGQGGDMLVAWNRARTVEARYRRVGGRWGRVQRLGTIPDSARSARVLTAVAQNGRAYVAWSIAKLAESDPLRLVGAAIRPADASRFGKAQILEQSKILDYEADIDLRLQIARPSAGAVLAWTGWNGPSGFRARLAATNARARFAAPEWVSPPGRRFGVGDLAIGPDGQQVLAMSELDHENLPKGVSAILRPSGGGSFGTPEEVGAAGSSSQAVAVNPITRQPTIVWSQRTGRGMIGPLNGSTRLPPD